MGNISIGCLNIFWNLSQVYAMMPKNNNETVIVKKTKTYCRTQAMNAFATEILNASWYTNNVAINIKNPANMPIKRAAPIDAKDNKRPISIIFTIPASPFTNFTAK